MRFFAYVLLAAAATTGCAESAAPTIPDNAGRDASIDPDGDGGFLDGDVGDAGTDASVPPDGGMGGGGSDGGAPDGGGPWCNPSALCPSCPDPDSLCDLDNPCPLGEVCLPTGCDDLSRCFVTGGGACQDDEDCADPAYACEQSIGRCLRSEAGCDDSNDCVAGFACEDEVCVDRRVPCTGLADCPHGYACFFASADQRFCRRISRPCGDDLDCLVLGIPCGDADGDGLQECMPSLMPNAPAPVSCANVECLQSAAPVCEPTPEGTGALCGQYGLCASFMQCAADFDCRDLWGDGRKECVEGLGSCIDSSVCALRNVCASPRAGGPPACLGGTAM